MDANDLEEEKTLKAEIRILKKALDIVGTFKETLEDLDARFKAEKAQAAKVLYSLPGIIKFKEGVLGVLKETENQATTKRRNLLNKKRI